MTRSDRDRDDRRLVRFLHGELPAGEAERLRRRLEREPELARRLRRLEAAWDGLELPPADPAPPGFAARIAGRAAEDGVNGSGEPEAFRPAWARAAAAAALTVGLAAGAVLARVSLPREPLATTAARSSVEASVETVQEEMQSSVPTLAESYWSALDEAGDDGAEDGVGGSEGGAGGAGEDDR